MSKKTKKIIIIMSIVLLVFISIIIGMLFLATDTFKSPEQLFYKYVAQNSKILEIFESESYELLNEKKKIAPYTSQGEISLNQAAESDTENEIIKILIEGKTDLPNKKQYNNINLVQNENSLFNIKYLRTGDKYALLSDEIVTKYVAVENNNLKELFRKMGMSEEELVNVPDRIENENLLDLVEFTEEEKEQILTKYTNLITTSISKEKFSKNKLDIIKDGQTHKANVYTLILTNVEIKNMGINILTTLQNDDATLNIVLNKYNKIANNGMTLENLKAQIANIIEQINNIQLDKTENISINLYVDNGVLLKTEVVTLNETVTIQYSTTEEKITITIISNSEEYSGPDNLEIKKIETDNEYSLNILLSDTQSENSISLQISNAGNISSNNIRQLNILKIIQDEETSEIRYSNNLTFDTAVEIEELNDENSVTINNYTQQELTDLITALQNRIEEVIEEKMMVLAAINTETNIDSNIETNEDLESNQQEEQDNNTISDLEQQEIDTFNEQFTPYLGEAVQGEKVKTLLQNVKTAVENGNIIKVSFSGVYNNTAVEKQGASAEEIEEMLIYVILSKNYFVEGLADTTGRLSELTIKENT